jgi:hypothetical protein
MYKSARKHIELFKKIPFDKFDADSNFIRKVVNQPEAFATYENILKVYYFIASEMWDPLNNKPIITNEQNQFCFYDFITKKQENLKKSRYKPVKMFNAVFNEKGQNRHYRKYHGLVAQPKSKLDKEEAYKLRDMFISYGYVYNSDFKFYNRNEFKLPPEWGEHLYELLNKLSEHAVFFYKNRGSMILAQEMISLLSNQSLFVYAANRIKHCKENKQKIMRQIREKKQFMFGEITHKYGRQKRR